MRRIDVDAKRMKVEHLRSQHRHPTLQLEWSNLLGACLGNEGSPPAQQTCDTRKGDADIGIDPLNIGDRDVWYSESGRIEARVPTMQHDLDDTLNLNDPALTRARQSALAELRARLRQKLGASGGWTAVALGRERQALVAKRPLPELLGVLEYWIVRHQRRR